VRRVVWALLGLLCIGVVTWALSVWDRAGDDPAADARAVYCLSGSRSTEIVHAAITMGAGSPVVNDSTRVLIRTKKTSRVVTSAELRTEFPDVFRRVCTAVMSADTVASGGSGGSGGDGGGSWVTTLLLPVVLAGLGAGFTYLGQFVERSSTRRDQRTTSLLDAFRDYQKSAEEYLDAWRAEQRPDHQGVLEKRRELLGVIRLLPSATWPGASLRALADDLPLAQALPETMGDTTASPLSIDPDTRKTMAQAERARIDRLAAQVSNATATWAGRAWLRIRNRKRS
jgi:hypothetical protein